MAPILGYWDLRGLVTPIRLLLAYADERYEFKGYTSFEGWFKEDKPALQNTLDFPNIPYYIDGKVKISQSKAILGYLGRKHKLDGESDEEKVRIALAIEFLEEMKSALIKIAYPAECATNRQEIHDTLLKDYEAGLEGRLVAFSKFLGTGKWVNGDRLTYADFFVYDILDWHRVLFDPKHVQGHKIICDYLDRFEGLKGVKEFLASEQFSRLPIFAPFAFYGNTMDWKRK